MNYSYFSKFPIDGVLVIFNEIYFYMKYFDYSFCHHGNQLLVLIVPRVMDFIPRIEPLILLYFWLLPVFSKCMFQ